MSALDTWMPIYIGDYLGDTAHLTTEQHGAYYLLMMHQWRRGSIPADSVSIAQIIRCTPARWETRIAPALMGFFTADGDTLVQMRLKAEREKAQQKSEKSTQAIKSRWEKNTKHVSSENNDVADTNVSNPNIPIAYPSPSPSETEERKEEREVSLSLPIPTKPARAAPVGAEFERFWQAYPRKVAKGGARKAWLVAIRNADPESIISAVCASTWRNNEYDPHPATWLNGERWLDAPALSLDQRLARIAGLDRPEDVFAATFRPDTNVVRLRA